MQSKGTIKIVERKADPELSESGVYSEKEFINKILDQRKEGLKIRRENLVSFGDFAIDQVRWYTWFQTSHEDEKNLYITPL